MSTAALRRAINEPRSVSRRFLVMLLGVIGIVVGLLAMHSFSSEPAHGAHVASAASTDLHTTASTTVPEADEEHCAAGCESHSAAAMMCVLALLVGLLLIALPRASRTLRPVIPWLAEKGRRGPPLRMLPPPSLHVLSISRT